MHGLVFNNTPVTETTGPSAGPSRRKVRAIKGCRLVSEPEGRTHSIGKQRYVEQDEAALCQANEDRTDQDQRAVPSQMRAIPMRIRTRSKSLARRFRSRKMRAAQRKDMITELRRTRDTTEIIESGSLNDV